MKFVCVTKNFLTQQFKVVLVLKMLAINLPTTTSQEYQTSSLPMHTVSLRCGSTATSLCITALPGTLLCWQLQVKTWNTARISWYRGTRTTQLIKINDWKVVCGIQNRLTENPINKQAHSPLIGWPQFTAGSKEVLHIGNSISKKMSGVSLSPVTQPYTKVNTFTTDLDQTGYRVITV